MSLWPNQFAERDRIGKFLFWGNLVSAVLSFSEELYVIGELNTLAGIALWITWIRIGKNAPPH